jgi:hypothetical protein
LPDLERALADDVLAQRRHILEANVQVAMSALRAEVARNLHMRTRELVEQVQELEGLRGKNAVVIRQMRTRIEQEQAEFDASGARIQAVRSVHLKMLKEVLSVLGGTQLRAEVAEFTNALRQPGIKLGVRKVYAQAFQNLAAGLDKAQGQVQDIHRMLDTSLRGLNTEFGFALQTPAPPDVRQRAHELDLIQRNHLQYLGLGNILKLAQIEFTERLGKALMSRLKAVYEGASTEVEQWNKAVASQLDTQLRERRRNFTRRIEAVTRIQQAAGGLDERIAELRAQQAQLEQLLARLEQLTATDGTTQNPMAADTDNPAPWPSAPDGDDAADAVDSAST